ncbi:hypothetical protein FH972_019936 [Carpinus fangiana]|uniref:GRF-type domain-containing protein n=1 Tax=Carpinus fangiana TaxID=176857 RepID=A0A5N6RUW4_9ROSI|nr:hypothetical protein FH972_019936 [Carpinus fangiana]
MEVASFCPCGAGRMLLLMAKTDSNYGHRFYRYPRWKNHHDGFLWIDDCPMDRTRLLRNDEDDLDYKAPMAGHHSVVSSTDGPQYSYEDNAAMGGGVHGKRSKIKHESKASKYHGERKIVLLLARVICLCCYLVVYVASSQLHLGV